MYGACIDNTYKSRVLVTLIKNGAKSVAYQYNAEVNIKAIAAIACVK